MENKKPKETKEAVNSRSARIRKAKREYGLVPIELWVRPDEKASISEKYDRSKEVEYKKNKPGRKTET